MEHVKPDCTCQGKRCTKCDQVRCVGQYNSDKRLRSGLKSRCKACDHADNKAWREANREYDRVRHKAWNDAHAEHISERGQRYREENRERLDAYRKQYYAKNVDQIRAKALQRYYDNHESELARKRNRRERPGVREQERATWKEYYQENRAWMSERVMAYFNSHPGYRASVEAARRTRKRQAGGSYTYQQWLELKARYNYTCLCCGRKEPEIQLHADHIIPVKKGGSSFIDNIQPLCKSCNSSKGTNIFDYRKDVL